MYSVLILSGISNQPAWWRVDLGASYDVYQVRIVNRDLGQGEFFVSSHGSQDCIPVGCVPPARWPYLPACSAQGGVCCGGLYLVLGDCLLWGGVPGPCGGYLLPGGCTWSWGVCSKGVSAPEGDVPGARGGCLLWGGLLLRGMYLDPGCVCSRECLLLGGCLLRGVYLVRYSPSCGQTHACKHITLPQTSFVGGNNRENPLYYSRFTNIKLCSWSKIYHNK